MRNAFPYVLFWEEDCRVWVCCIREELLKVGTIRHYEPAQVVGVVLTESQRKIRDVGQFYRACDAVENVRYRHAVVKG